MAAYEFTGMTKEKFAWAGMAVPLGWLAELDDIPAANALADGVGDRYLYRHCPVFRSIRDAVLDLGFRFSSADTFLWRDYLSFPLMSLKRILANKTIPYVDNGTTFRRLIQEYPGVRLPPGFVTGNLKANHAFHESAHCVAHAILQTKRFGMRPARACAAVDAVFAESFANTVEALGTIFTHMPLSDHVFYPLNSYVAQNKRMQDVLVRAAELGAERRFTLLFLSYFKANLTTDKPTDRQFEQIAEAGECTFGEYALVRELTGIAFGLNQEFRESTNPAYFDLLGLGNEYRELSGGNWPGDPGNQCFAREVASQFWEAAGKP